MPKLNPSLSFPESLNDKRAYLLNKDHYELLIEIQKELDKAIYFVRSRGSQPHFDKVQQSVEISLRRTFTLKQLEQIVELCPDFYVFLWDKDIKLNDWKLRIEIP